MMSSGSTGKRAAAWAALALLCATASCGGHSGSAHKDAGGDGVSRVDAADAAAADHPAEAGVDAGACLAPDGKLANGGTCACNSDCANGHCVDGICCNEACSNGCQSCSGDMNGMGAGTCVFVPAGTSPVNSTTCPQSPMTSCGLDGTCDGHGGCEKYLGNTCQAGSCGADGNTVVGSSACDGEGNCKAGAATVICVPYTCNAATGSCFSSCTSNAQCVGTKTCQDASCGLGANGTPCTSAGMCASNYCVDGVCCNVACTGPCLTCDLPSRLGTCSPIAADLPDRRGICQDQGSASCGQTGLCDGVGGCSLYARDTVCLSPTCSTNRLNTAGTCDGLGVCRPPGVQDCHPFRCVDGACTNTCQSDADCDTGAACNLITNTCGPKPNGQQCALASDCQSGFCVDGVCCENACAGACRSCALPTTPGQCVNIATGNPDTRGVCPDMGAPSCLTNGKCDGSGGCQNYAVGTVCAAQTCVSNVYTPPSTCTANGLCVAPDSLPCSPYVCNGSQCFTTCATNAQCLGLNVCDVNNTCGPKSNGASCGTNGECASGFCAQGICCNSACSGACQSCALTQTLGTCTNVPNNSPDPAGKCVDQGPASCGTNGKCQAGACQQYVQGTQCTSPTCPTSNVVFTPAGQCDGAGTCQVPGSSSCFPFECGVNQCKAACTTDGDCAPPAVCNAGGSCGLKSNGKVCATGAECMSAFCAQGICCATACQGACQSCGLSTSLGVCTNVANGATDPQGTCHDMGSASCNTDGFCNGGGACRLYGAGTSCAAPSCPSTPSPGATLTSGRTCDGKGACQVATSIACMPYVCNGSTACKATCTADTDCLSPNICDPTTNLCGNKKRLGQACATSNDCLTLNACVDGVCCSATACGTCQACNVNGSAGNCAPVPSGTSEPHGLCAPSPPCGNTGTCNGAGGCLQASTSVSCGTASCAGSTFTPLSHCSGAGACAAPTSSSCTPFVCGTNACKTTCTTDADCLAPFTCQGSTTKSCALKPSGQTCTTNSQCISGFCTDGVCCGSASCPTCQACNVNGLGSCSNIAAGGADPRGGCPASPPCGNTGTCNGGGACTQAPSSVTCGVPVSCIGTTFQPPSVCSGAGTCNQSAPTGCGLYVCGTGACKVSCSADTDCTAGNYCTGAGGSCVAMKAAGLACGTAHECSSGNCVDGVCCTSASCATCQACNLNGAGTCANVATGSADPHGGCVASPPCGNTGLCSAGACQQASTAVSCGLAVSCTGSTLQPASFCSGAGTCGQTSTTTCGAYVCGGSACKTSCTADTDCTTGNYCTGAGGSCVPKKGMGLACGAGNECTSGNCVDGVCCTTASCATCQACNAGTTPGTCGNVGAITDPHGRCPAAPPCGNTGLCNGAGACQQAANNVSCSTASCTGTTFTPPAFCSGSGACTPATPSGCGQYVCGTNACKTTCNADTDCIAGDFCNGTGGSCVATKANGSTCVGGNECTSASCVDGVCCGSASCPTCQACNVTGSRGACANVGTIADPHARCPANAPCGNTGVCNGSGACQQAATSVSCGAATCVGTTFTPTAFCSGTGTCSPAPTSSCGQYVCGASACKTSCAADTDCIATDYCNGTSCVAKKGNGAACVGGNECTSASCVDGVCCGSASCPTCQACNVSGSAGICAAVGVVADPHAGCPAGPPCGNTGLCNGAGACQQTAMGTSCGLPSCSGSSFTPGSTCSGSGSCLAPGAVSCAPYVCTTGGCDPSCNSDADCIGGDYCTGAGGSCQPKKAAGVTCTADDQCGTGHCTEGFCCGSDACPSCQSCAVAGAQGACTNVPAGGADPVGACATVSAMTCGQDGVCDGAGSCQLYSGSTQCEAVTCPLGTSVLTGARFCDSGLCDPGSQTSCAPYMCNSTASACLTSCATDQDCAPPNTCSLGMCVPPVVVP